MENSQPSIEAAGDQLSEVLGEVKVEGEGKSEVVVRLQPAAISFINVKLARVIILPLAQMSQQIWLSYTTLTTNLSTDLSSDSSSELSSNLSKDLSSDLSLDLSS